MSVEIPLLFQTDNIQTLGPEFRMQQKESRDQGLIDPMFKTDVNNPVNFKTEFTVFDAKNSEEPSPENEEIDILQILAHQDLNQRKRPVSMQEAMLYDLEDENLDPGFVMKIQRDIEDEPSRDFVELVRESNQSARREDNIYGRPPRTVPFDEELKDLKKSIEGSREKSFLEEATDVLFKEAKAEGQRVVRSQIRNAVREFIAQNVFS